MFILLFLPMCLAIPIDNGILGEPEIECDATQILVYFNTRNEFKGQTYIKVGVGVYIVCFTKQ